MKKVLLVQPFSWVDCAAVLAVVELPDLVLCASTTLDGKINPHICWNLDELSHALDLQKLDDGFFMAKKKVIRCGTPR